MTDAPVTTAALSEAKELPATARRLLDGAAECFATRGYQATTTRDVSNHASVSPGALYVHYESKEHLLYELIREAHAGLIRTLSALEAVESGDELRLIADQIRSATLWHIENQKVARVAQQELPNLTPEHFQSVRDQRSAIEGILRAPVVAGCEAGTFDVPDPQLFVRAVLSLTVDAIRWYSPSSRYSPEQLAANNVEILTAYLLRPRATEA